MAEALALARLGLASTDPNPRVGCVIVNGDRVVGTGYHRRAGEAHAEVHALRQAGSRARGATAYVTLEPCSHHGRTPPCADALVKAGIARVVVAMVDPCEKVAGAGLQKLRAHGIEVVTGVLSEEAESLSRGFFHRMRTGRPWVRVKLAQSLDGRSAMATGESQWITGTAARRHAQLWRARSAAIVTGIGTVLADDCRLTVRPDQLPPDLPFDTLRDQPVRVVLDTHLRLPVSAKILKQAGKTVILTAASESARQDWLDQWQQFRRENPENKQDRSTVSLVPVPEETAGRLDLSAVMEWLASQAFNEVLVEAGATLAGAFLERELADELLVYTAPVLLGHEARPVLRLPIERMADKRNLQVQERRLLGPDEFLRAWVSPQAVAEAANKNAGTPTNDCLAPPAGE